MREDRMFSPARVADQGLHVSRSTIRRSETQSSIQTSPENGVGRLLEPLGQGCSQCILTRGIGQRHPMEANFPKLVGPSFRAKKKDFLQRSPYRYEQGPTVALSPVVKIQTPECVTTAIERD